MSDTPIYNGVGKEDGPTGDPNIDRLEGWEKIEAKHGETGPWILSGPGRRWLYTVAAAILVVVAGYLGLSAGDQESWLNLVGAVLNIGGAGALTYARKKVER